MLEGIIRVHHIAISTPDLERLVAFYRDVLGFEVIEEFDWEKGDQAADQVTGLKDSAAKAVMLKGGNFHLEIFEFQSPPPKPVDPNRPVCDHGLTHFSFEVTDVQAVYDRLKKAGVRFNCPPEKLGDLGTAIYGRDPDGNVIELQGP
jgi:catechol 2,3-dioxygenase-like lactoylglutathione lyase family enzyme